jgi:2-aminobenzoate-CoA ligase
MALAQSAHRDDFCQTHLPPAEQLPTFTFDLPGLAYPDRLNAARELLTATAARLGGDRPCLHAGDDTWSYADLDARSDRVADLLVGDHGLVPGNRVLLRGPNNPWLVACWFAVVKAGGVVVPTMPLLRARELATIAEIAQVDLAICDHRFTDDLAAAQIPGLRTIVYGGAADDDLVARSADRPAGFTAVDTAATDICLLAFTSGTTGRPKATMHHHRDLLAVADTFGAQVLKPLPDDVFIGTPPIAFTFGLGGLVVFPLRVGASTVLVERATPAELAEQIRRYRVTVCFTAPTAYKAMLAGGDVEALRTVRRAVSAGEHLPLATWHAFKDATGVGLIDGIGSTEMLHIFIGSADDDIRPGSTGRAVPGYRAKVVDLTGAEVPDGEPGRLAVQGPTGCRYLDDPRQTVYVQGGWNLTGDTFVRDPDGYFWYQGRSDDMIVSSGYNISGTEVEEALTTHPEVAECAVVGAPDEARGQVVTAFVVLKRALVELTDERRAELVKALQDHVKQQIAPYKYPRAVHLVDALPRTSTGKVQRFVLRRQTLPIS